MKHPIGDSSNGVTVCVDLIRSKAAAHIAQQPHLLGLIREAVSKTTVRGPQMSIEHDMGRAIGYNFVIPTTEKHTILYARMVHDELYTRFVKNGQPQPTQYITIILTRSETGDSYELQDAWIGRVSPPRPGSQHETPASKSYWSTHAHILNNESLQLRTVTKTCPY
ncbi:MAG TPA: hypothetical protein VLH84_00490 [Patescibacteria group bacterium]|nr:hypothetical protein [Patescibacteria group bacterium]